MKEDGTYEVVVRPIGVLALTWDHRAFDGAYSAASLRLLRAELEGRDWAAEVRKELAEVEGVREDVSV
jgi:2-oxoglutarate dehydrogenase E2 component (dihydrolipoamide succinyltransferase)